VPLRVAWILRKEVGNATHQGLFCLCVSSVSDGVFAFVWLVMKKTELGFLVLLGVHS